MCRDWREREGERESKISLILLLKVLQCYVQCNGSPDVVNVSCMVELSLPGRREAVPVKLCQWDRLERARVCPCCCLSVMTAMNKTSHTHTHTHTHTHNTHKLSLTSRSKVGQCVCPPSSPSQRAEILTVCGGDDQRNLLLSLPLPQPPLLSLRTHLQRK